MELVVGVDVATAAVRVVALDADGRQHAAAEAPLAPPSRPRPGWVEQDAGSWWPAVGDALAALTTQLGSARTQIVACSVASTSGTVAAVDVALRPLAPALLYADQRAVSQAQAARNAGAARWARLGLQVQPSFGLPKMAWLWEQLRAAGTAAASIHMVHAADVIVGHLVGEQPPSDTSHALKSGYDPQEDEWAVEAMEALDLPLSALPQVGRPTQPVGTITPAAAERTGLPAGCEVRLGMTDSCAAQLAAGASTPGQFVSVLGSTLVLKGVSTAPVVDPSGAVYSHRHPDGWWLPGGASSAGGAALLAGWPGRDLAELDARAAAHGPASGVIYPLVGHGERFPFAVHDAEGFTLGALDDEVARYRATLEGVAFVERLGYQRLADLGAPASAPILVTGGGSASAVWNQIRATVLGEVLRAVPSATTARGAAILAAAGTLHPDLVAATAAMAAAGHDVEALPADAPALEDNFQQFVAALHQRGWWPPGNAG